MTTNQLELLIKNAILAKEEKAYEEFVINIYKIEYKEDFQPVKPSGRDGDLANDGYVSKKLLIQVYAPATIKQTELIKKFHHDLERAKEYWDFREWHFVINDKFKGIPPKVAQEIESVKDIAVKIFNAHDIKQRVIDLANDEPMHIYILLNFEKNIEDFDDFEKLTRVIDFLAQTEDVRQEEFVNFGNQSFYQGQNQKIEINIRNNQLKDYFTKAIIASRKIIERYKDKIGEEYINKVQERVVATYKAYEKEMSYEDAIKATFDDIYAKMNNDHNLKAALWIMIACFFDICDIGEKPDGNGG